jgi:hypothetical protein
MIHPDHRRREDLLQKLNDALKSQRALLENSFRKNIEEYTHNYESLMRMCYLCEKYSLGDSIETFRQKRRQFLQALHDRL